VHRSLSEVSPIFDDDRYSRLVLFGGDLNTWTGWNARRDARHLARDRVVLERIRAYGLVDCLERVRPSGRLKGCTCSLGEQCTHTWTRLDPRYPRTRYQMDYLFASTALAERLVHCKALSPTEWSRFSDHSPIVATFA
jgi:exonuclease III